MTEPAPRTTVVPGLWTVVGFLVAVEVASGVLQGFYTPIFSDIADSLRIADGVALDGVAFIRYPEAAAHLRALMQRQGLPVPPVEWDGPREAAAR